MYYETPAHNTPEARIARNRQWDLMKEDSMPTPKEAARKKMWEAQLEYAVTSPVDHEMISELVEDLTAEEILAIPYLPNRNDYV